MAKEKSKIIKEANKEVEEILSDGAIKEINYYYEKWSRDDADARQYAYKKGEKQGEKKAIIEMAKEMKKNGMDIETISKITKLSKEEIIKL